MIKIPNQIFIGCPWKNIKPKYERIRNKLSQKFPQSLILIGGRESQSAEDLLKVIEENLEKSTCAIFDVTGGNPNVSLEFGFAKAKDLNVILYMSGRQNRVESEDSAIISDLAGKIRSHYKTEKGLQNLLEGFCRNHEYTKRYEEVFRHSFFRKSKGIKRSYRTLGLKIIHFLDENGSCRRDDLDKSFQSEGYHGNEIEEILSAFHRGGIIKISTGRYSTVVIS